MNGILYADDLVLRSESMQNLRKIFLKWKETFESKRLKINLKKTKGKKYSRVKSIHVPRATRGCWQIQCYAQKVVNRSMAVVSDFHSGKKFSL